MLMLDRYMESDEYCKEIESAVDANPQYRAVEKEYLEVLKNLNLDMETYDLVDRAAVFMMMAARELAYKKGFQDGVNLIVECGSGTSKANDELVNWFIKIVEKDPIKAYRIMEVVEILCGLSDDDLAKAAAFIKKLGEVQQNEC